MTLRGATLCGIVPVTSYELIYVLSGELATDDGTYQANSLLVMPPGSVHAPRSPHGCVGLVVWERPVRSV